MNTKRYALIGSVPFTGYTGTRTSLGLRVVGAYSSAQEASNAWHQHYNANCGLMLILDKETDLQVDPLEATPDLTPIPAG